MKYHALAAIAAMGVAVSGCATIIKGTTQSVSVSTDPVEGARCELTSSEGTWYITTPGSVVVHKTKNDLKVVCTKDGYQEATATIPSSFNGATAGNIIAGGLIGVGIDAASGANYEYPPSTHIPMTRVGATEPDARTAPADTAAAPAAPAEGDQTAPASNPGSGAGS
jgi:hypothetical protein